MLQPIQKVQIQKIKILQKQLGWSEDFYRDTLAANFQGKCSCKALSRREAGDLIHLMEKFKPKSANPRIRHGTGGRTHADLKDQAGDGGRMRTAKQLRKIEGMYYASPQIGAKTPAGLNAFCAEILKRTEHLTQRQAKHLRWLTRAEATQVITILEKSYAE